MSANWFVTKDVRPEDKMPETNWVWVVDPCHLCPKSGYADCKAWEACMRKKRDQTDPKLRHPTPKLRRVKKSELNPRTDHACVMQSDGDTIAWDANTKCWVPCDQCWSLAQCIENDHALERKAIAFLNINSTPGVTPAKRACKNGASWSKSPAQECKTPGKDTVCHDPKRSRPSPGKPLRPPAETPARHSRLNAPQRNLVANSIGSSAPSSGRDNSPGRGLPKVGAVTAYESSDVHAATITNGRISRETVAGNRMSGHFCLSPRSPIHPKPSTGEKNTSVVRGRQAAGKSDDAGRRVTWDVPLAPRADFDPSSFLPRARVRMEDGLSPNGTAGERVKSGRSEDGYAQDVGSAVDVIPPPADMRTVSPDDEQAATSGSRAGEVSGSPSETRVTSAEREEVAPQINIEALRERARMAGGKVEKVTRNLKGIEQLIITTNADMERLRIVLYAAEKKQAEIKQTQHACMAESAAARGALAKVLKQCAERLKEDAAKKAQDARDLEEEMRSLA